MSGCVAQWVEPSLEGLRPQAGRPKPQYKVRIQPWEKSMLDEITKAVINANLGLNPQSNGEVFIIAVPVLTEERRRDLVFFKLKRIFTRF